jgi:O-antigen ligase
VKVMLGLSHPLTLTPDVTGAAAIDIVFAASVLGLVVRHRIDLVAIWRCLGGLERVAVGLLGSWLAISVLQIHAGGIARALDGFRLTQAYVAALIGGVLMMSAARGSKARRVITAVLFGIAVVAGYAALRAAIGPADAERSFALSRPGVTQYGSAFRTVGSFSGAVGLASFLVPAGVFAFGLGVRFRRWRKLCAVAFGAALVGVVTSYSRAGVVALLAGIAFVAALSLALRGLSPRAVRILFASAVVTIAIGAGATALASRASPQVSERAHIFVDPGSDASLHIRLRTLRRSLTVVARHPFGTGLGTVGRASRIGAGPTVTTDNSYVKALQEEGIPGGVTFLCGLVLLCVAVTRGLRSAAPAARSIGAAALAAFVSFALLAATGEYFEQPGKVLAWSLLGVAVWAAYAAPPEFEVDAD